HQLAEGGREAALRDLNFCDTEALEAFERKIDAALAVVYRDVLPEVSELQCGAGVVGEVLAFRVGVAAEAKDEMADGVRGVLAVVEDVSEGRKARDGLVAAEGDEQIGELVLRDAELLDGLAQRNEDGMTGGRGVAGVEFLLPGVEQRERLLGV